MAKILLITDPNDDEPCSYLNAWCQKIISIAERKRSVKIFYLHKEDANEKKLTDIIKREQPRLILFNGHGDEDRIFGFNQQILIKADHNDYLLKNKIVHSLSCRSGKTLGPKAIKIGALVYVGYSENFKFNHFNKSTKEERLLDGIANFFLEPAFEAVISLIEGDIVENAYRKSQRLYLENLKFLVSSSETDYNTTLASRLFHDMKCQVCLGKKDIVL